MEMEEAIKLAVRSYNKNGDGKLVMVGGRAFNFHMGIPGEGDWDLNLIDSTNIEGACKFIVEHLGPEYYYYVSRGKTGVCTGKVKKLNNDESLIDIGDQVEASNYKNSIGYWDDRGKLTILKQLDCVVKDGLYYAPISFLLYTYHRLGTDPDYPKHEKAMERYQRLLEL